MLSAILFLVVVFVATTHGQYSGCDYAQPMVAGRSYDVFSPGYPNRPYTPGSMCRWTATAPAGTRISVSCSDIRMPYSQSCSGDRIEISYSGNSLLSDAQRYCTNNPFTYQSQSNRLVIALKSAPYGGSGGYFLCKISVVSGAAPVTPKPSVPDNSGQCGRRKSSRIVGGYTPVVNEYPMMAGLVDKNVGTVFCGATIVNNFNAVTAAHCLSNKYVAILKLLVGDHDTNTGADTPYSKLYDVASFRIHPSYSASNDLNDIALVRTTKMIDYNVAVGPVCLPYGNEQLVGQMVEVVGWGTTSIGGKPSSVLKYTSIQVISNDQCKQVYGSKITYSHICTLTANRDACQMDSGGPLYLQSGNALYLAGIISFGTGCGDGKPGVNTRVTYYADWIRANM